MVQVKIKSVISFSSEDPKHPVSNLVKSDPNSKWKCSKDKCGEQAWVCLKLENLTQITSLDIGNESSAIIEVIVAREGVEEKVLLPASSFMSPLDSRKCENLNRVRMFSSNNLSKDVMNDKWDRVKVVCTQPFNKSLQHGINFIRLQCSQKEEKSETTAQLGSFKLSLDDSEDTSIKEGFLFSNRKSNDKPPRLFNDEEIKEFQNKEAKRKEESQSVKRRTNAEEKGKAKKTRTVDEKVSVQSSSTSKSNKHSQKESSKSNESSQAQSNYSKDKKNKSKNDGDKKESPSFDNQSKGRENTPSGSKGKKEYSENNSYENKKGASSGPKKRSENTPSGSKGKKEKKEYSENNSYENKKGDSSSPKKHPSYENQKASSAEKRPQKNHRPFNSLMGDVVFVMSGYKNPQRSELRDNLTKMGAKYKSDWDPTCTHLICAFHNTPKFREVKGKGKIVSEKWIEQSYKDQIRHPWRRFNMERDNSAESEEEVYADELIKDELEANSNDDVSSENDNAQMSEEDTDDEINRIINGTKEKLSVSRESDKGAAANVFDADTDEDETLEKTDTSKLSFPQLPDFFTGNSFYLYGYDSNVFKILRRHIIACGGECESKHVAVDFVITDNEWNRTLADISKSNPKAQFIKSEWIFNCLDEDLFVSSESFQIKKK